jgi:hypothetical protein
MKKALLALLASTSMASAADLALLKAPPQAYSDWFFLMGVEAGGAVTNHSFDFFNTGTGTVEVGGALAGALVGLEYKKAFMARFEIDADYDFGRGGATCMGMGVACHLTHGGLITERVDLGLPLPFLGGTTPYVSAGVQQAQTFAAIDNVGSGSAWYNAFVAGAGLDVPMGTFFSLGLRWDHVWPGHTIGIAPAIVSDTNERDVFKANLKWRLN